MKTTIELPEKLVAEAMRLSRQKSKTAVVITALEDFVRRRKIDRLKAYRGKVQLELDLNALRKRR